MADHIATVYATDHIVGFDRCREMSFAVVEDGEGGEWVWAGWSVWVLKLGRVCVWGDRQTHRKAEKSDRVGQSSIVGQIESYGLIRRFI